VLTRNAMNRFFMTCTVPAPGAASVLNVASEIVRRQDAFLVEGVSALKPLNLKMIGEAIGVHESTVSRATAHKYIQTPRGLFEMKYFFTAAIPSADSGEAHSAEAVRQRIRQMIDEEHQDNVLSDDSIVERLRKADIVVARRTVAKYRDSLKIPSSVERRRLKMSPTGAPRVRADSLPVNT
jgi:RNA polymerase sigma-54 factor